MPKCRNCGKEYEMPYPEGEFEPSCKCNDYEWQHTRDWQERAEKLEEDLKYTIKDNNHLKTWAANLIKREAETDKKLKEVLQENATLRNTITALKGVEERFFEMGRKTDKAICDFEKIKERINSLNFMDLVSGEFTRCGIIGYEKACSPEGHKLAERIIKEIKLKLLQGE